METKLTPEQLLAQHFEPLAVSDRMLVDFMLKGENAHGGAAASATQPAVVTIPADPATTARPHRTTDTTETPQTATSLAVLPATRPTTRPTTQSAATQPTKPAEPPMYVYWTGPLHVEPYADQLAFAR